MALEARSLKSRCHQVLLLLKSVREGLPHFLACVGLLAIFSLPGLIDTSLQSFIFTWSSPCVSSHRLPFLCVSISMSAFPLFITQVTLGSTLINSFSPLCLCAQSLHHVWLFVTPWTVAHQAPLSMGFPRQEYWSRLPFPLPGALPDQGVQTHISCIFCIGSQILYHWTTWEDKDPIS